MKKFIFLLIPIFCKSQNLQTVLTNGNSTTAGAAVKNMAGGSITSLTNGHTYLFLWNTSNWIAVLQ